jgi:hypothetical protein
MTSPPPQLVRCLAFISGRLVKASRDAETRPTKANEQRLRSLEILAGACVAEAARLSGSADPPRLDAAPPPRVSPAAELTEADLRGVWTRPE